MRYWSLLFALIAVLVIAAFLYAPLDHQWWLPGYRATNAEALETLEDLDARLTPAIETLDGIQAATDAPTEEQVEQMAALHDWLELQAAQLDRLARDDYLTNRTRQIGSLAIEAAASVDQVRLAMARGDAGATIDPAIDDLTALEEAASEAMAEVLGPSESLDGPLSSAAYQIDHLFLLILVITGLTFLGVMVALVYAIWRFAARSDRRADYYHGSQRLEVIWTIIPAAILIFIALYQLGAWADIKFQNTWPDVKPLAEVTARQFQWKIRYPGPDGDLNTADDLHTVNDLHFVKDSPTIIYLKSEDVLHSFFLPQLRIKQDAVPGLTIPVLFDAEKAGRYELLCAELCGWGHYKMRANVTVHESQGEFDEWMEQSLLEQNQDQLAAAPEPQSTSGPRVE